MSNGRRKPGQTDHDSELKTRTPSAQRQAGPAQRQLPVEVELEKLEAVACLILFVVRTHVETKPDSVHVFCRLFKLRFGHVDALATSSTVTLGSINPEPALKMLSLPLSRRGLNLLFRVQV